MKKILIAIPTNKYIEPETFKSIWDLEIPEGYETDFQYFYGYQIDQIRNLIAEWAKSYDYLFAVDSDIIVPPNTLKNFLYSGKDIISGLYIQRIENTHKLEIYKDTPNGGCVSIQYEELKDRGIVEVAACGFGCVMIDSKVMRKLPYPHFEYHSAISHANTLSEDIDFCIKARKAGFKIWADTSIICDHIGSKVFKVEKEVKKELTLTQKYEHIQKNLEMPKNHKLYLDYMKANNVNPKVIYDIGSNLLHWSKIAKEVWADSSIFAFDAVEEFEELYYKNNWLTGFSTELLGDFDLKEVEFFKNIEHPAGSSIFRENPSINPIAKDLFPEKSAIKRNMVRLDTIVKEWDLPKPQLIKIDVQGGELNILKGALNTLKECKDLIIEMPLVEYNIGAPTNAELSTFLDQQGFKLKTKINETRYDYDAHYSRS
jgi:FkbM family methyltransferase